MKLLGVDLEATEEERLAISQRARRERVRMSQILGYGPDVSVRLYGQPPRESESDNTRVSHLGFTMYFIAVVGIALTIFGVLTLNFAAMVYGLIMTTFGLIFQFHPDSRRKV